MIMYLKYIFYLNGTRIRKQQSLNNEYVKFVERMHFWGSFQEFQSLTLNFILQNKVFQLKIFLKSS
jgi:hypothetical protein